MSKDLVYNYDPTRLTQKIGDKYYAKPDISTRQCENKLGQLEDLMEKYEINSVEALEEILKDYDEMAKDIVEMALGVKVEFEE